MVPGLFAVQVMKALTVAGVGYCVHLAFVRNGTSEMAVF